MNRFNRLIEAGIYHPKFRVATCALLAFMRKCGDSNPQRVLFYAQGMLFATKNKSRALEVLTQLPQPWTLEMQALHQYAYFEVTRAHQQLMATADTQLYQEANTAYSHLALARYYYQVLSNLDEARLALLRAIHHKPVPEWMMEYSFLCNYLERDEEAVLWLERALGLLYEKSAYQLYISLLLKLERYEQALVALRNSFKDDGVLIEYALTLILLEEFYGNHKRALKWATKVKRYYFKLTSLQRNDFCLYYIYKRKTKAIRSLINWDLSTSLSGSATLVRLLYAESLKARDLVAESRWHAGVLVEQDPLRVLLLQRMQLVATENEVAFISPYLFNNEVFLPWNIENFFRDKRKNPILERLHFLHEVLTVYPTHPFCHLELAKAQGGRYEMSAEFNSFITQVRHKPTLYLERARAFLHTQRYDEAHQDLESFIAANNNKSTSASHLIKAQLHTAQKLWRLAIYEYKQACKLAEPTNTIYLLAAKSIFELFCQLYSPKKAAKKTQRLRWRFYSADGFLLNAHLALVAGQPSKARYWQMRAQYRKAQNMRNFRSIT
jgi:hypothetical protein